MPAGIINTGSHPKLLWPGVHATWGQVYDAHPKEYSDLYDIETSDRAYEEDVQITGFGLAPIKTEGNAGSFDSEVQGIISRYVHLAYSLGYIVTYEELEDNLYAEVAARRAKANAFSMSQTVETVCAFLYNNAFATTYFTTGDAAALISASHVKATGGTYSNALTPAADLSEAALEDIATYVDADEAPEKNIVLKYVPWTRTGEGKEQQLDAARGAAVWPEATDEQLMLPKEELTKLLEARLPSLMTEFRKAVESLGFTW